MRPPKRTRPPPSRAVRPSSRAPPASNVIRPLIASSECGSAKCRMRPPAIDALPENTGLSSGPRTSAARSAWPELRISRKNPCRMLEVGVARRVQRNLPVGESDGAVHVEPRVLADQPHLLDLHDLLIEEQAHGAVVPQRVVEQPQCRPGRRCHRPAGVRRGSTRRPRGSLPLTTAVVNGDSRGSKARTYGSSEVSVNRSVSSASDSGVSAMRPVADTDEPGRRRFHLHRHDVSLRTASRPVTSPMPSSLTKRSLTLNRTSYRGSSNRPLPDGREVEQPGERRLRVRAARPSSRRARVGPETLNE